MTHFKVMINLSIIHVISSFRKANKNHLVNGHSDITRDLKTDWKWYWDLALNYTKLIVISWCLRGSNWYICKDLLDCS